jgi:molybdopterin biosynthesis enzyme
MRPFKSTISIDEARRLLTEAVRPIERTEQVDLIAAEGRVAAADVRSAVDVPPFARSAMDEYAVVSCDYRQDRKLNWQKICRPRASGLRWLTR